ncbi:HPr family phosphocarrier protein [Actinomycetaceae bacterium MB13-C1-2]|nr:HPr family phosphocarrier protein [Actinomycetaceae bacterium MB13-C1-2]
MAQKTVKVGSRVGLHARPASLVADRASDYNEEILIAVEGGDPVDATSQMMIMTLGADHGDKVVIESENEEAVEVLAAMIESDLDA